MVFGDSSPPAVRAEAIRTICSVAPLPDLLGLAAVSASALFDSKKLVVARVAGLAALTDLAIAGAAILPEQQSTVIDCIDDRDDTVRGKVCTYK